MNSFKTWMLMGLLTIIVVMAGGALGGQNGATMAFLFALVMNGVSYWYSDRIVLSMSRAEELSEGDSPELFAIVGRLSDKAGIPMPRIYVTPQDQPNAFATGRGPGHSSIAVTQGLIRLLDSDEVAGVLAHEISHIRHRDILVASLAATLAGAITMLANMARWAAFFGAGRNSDDDGEGAGNFAASLLMIILAPIAATLVQLAISRSREYMADASAAELTGRPNDLADALEKLAYGTREIPADVNPATAHMYIASPMGGGLFNLFSTHPPIEERIKRLRAMA